MRKLFILEKIVMISNTIIRNNLERKEKDINFAFFATNNNLIVAHFYLDISGDIFSIFGFLIYLEVIEFYCFGLNKDYRKNIMRRGTEECINILEDLTDDISETGNDDDIETKGTIELISQKSS